MTNRRYTRKKGGAGALSVARGARGARSAPHRYTFLPSDISVATSQVLQSAPRRQFSSLTDNNAINIPITPIFSTKAPKLLPSVASELSKKVSSAKKRASSATRKIRGELAKQALKAPIELVQDIVQKLDKEHEQKAEHGFNEVKKLFLLKKSD